MFWMKQGRVDFMAIKKRESVKLTADQVLKALNIKHKNYNEWAFFDELRVGTGYLSKRVDGVKVNPEQRFDAFVLNLYPSNKHLRIIYEIKVSRSDFLHEIKHPEKRESALLFSNQYYFATPAGLVDVDEIPEECGLIEVYANMNTRIKKEAPLRPSANPSWNFLCSIARRTQLIEKGLK
jgi:hypothetical protein